MRDMRGWWNSSEACPSSVERCEAGGTFRAAGGTRGDVSLLRGRSEPTASKLVSQPPAEHNREHDQGQEKAPPVRQAAVPETHGIHGVTHTQEQTLRSDAGGSLPNSEERCEAGGSVGRLCAKEY